MGVMTRPVTGIKGSYRSRLRGAWSPYYVHASNFESHRIGNVVHREASISTAEAFYIEARRLNRRERQWERKWDQCQLAHMVPVPHDVLLEYLELHWRLNELTDRRPPNCLFVIRHHDDHFPSYGPNIYTLQVSCSNLPRSVALGDFEGGVNSARRGRKGEGETSRP